MKKQFCIEFLGPPGVGKSYIAQKLYDQLADSCGHENLSYVKNSTNRTQAAYLRTVTNSNSTFQVIRILSSCHSARYLFFKMFKILLGGPKTSLLKRVKHLLGDFRRRCLNPYSEIVILEEGFLKPLDFYFIDMPKNSDFSDISSSSLWPDLFINVITTPEIILSRNNNRWRQLDVKKLNLSLERWAAVYEVLKKNRIPVITVDSSVNVSYNVRLVIDHIKKSGIPPERKFNKLEVTP